MTNPECLPRACPQTYLGHYMCLDRQCYDPSPPDMGIRGFYLFSELVSCITKVLLALDTKYKRKKEQSEVHFFWSTWFSNGPSSDSQISTERSSQIRGSFWDL